MNSRPTSANSGARAAQLVKYENQTEDSADPFGSEDARDNCRCRRAGRVPVEAIENRKKKQSGWFRYVHQDKKRGTAQGVNHREHFPRIDPVDQPTRKRRAEEACAPHDSNG